MLFRFHQIIHLFFWSIIRYKLTIKKGNNMLYYCGASIFKDSFRYSNSSIKDNLIAIRIFKTLVYSLFKKNTSYINYKNASSHAIFDVNIEGSELRFNYVDKFDGVKNDLFISKNELISFYNIWMTIILLFFLITTFIPIFISSIFTKNKYHYSLLVREILECFCLQEILLKHKIKAVNYFCIYERDSNICSYILMKNGFFINKISSEVPMYFFNKVIIANQLSFCFAYQKEEFDKYKETMFVEKTELWAPEQILLAPKRFFNEGHKLNPMYDIGFFSSGNWLRFKLGDIDLGHNDKENEEYVFQELIKYVKAKKLKLRIFTHPLEKREENKVLTENYYYQSLQNVEVSMADFNKPSIEGFDEIKIGVSLYSTLMFERIYLGFKTILTPFDYDQFPIKQSSLNQICAHNIQQLYSKLDLNLKLTTAEFFENNNLQNYSTLLH